VFKNAILYRLASDTQSITHNVLEPFQFVPCGPSQEKSVGWVPPREPNGSLSETVDGQIIIKLMTETKAIPADVVNRKAAERAAQIEATTGRKPGKKETRYLKDDIRLELLPHAFPKQAATLIWIDMASRLVLVDASGQAKADDAVSALVASIPGIALQWINSQTSPTAAMAGWLIDQEPPAGFSVDRECELKASDESKAVVKYGKHRLDISEVPDHIKAGKMPTKLAMTWADRVSFVLTDGLTLKKLAFLDVTFDDYGKDDGFDADVAIATGELSKLIPDLLDALGGEVAAA